MRRKGFSWPPFATRIRCCSSSTSASTGCSRSPFRKASTSFRCRRRERSARDPTSPSSATAMVHYANEAAKNLEAEGVSVEIVDLRTVYPLDREAIIASAKKTGKCMVLYEDNFSVSVGSEVAALIADEAWSWLDAPVKRFGGLDVPSMAYAIPMEEYFMPTPEKITKALLDLAAY